MGVLYFVAIDFRRGRYNVSKGTVKILEWTHGADTFKVEANPDTAGIVYVGYLDEVREKIQKWVVFSRTPEGASSAMQTHIAKEIARAEKKIHALNIANNEVKGD